jgi:hypothetical protein
VKIYWTKPVGDVKRLDAPMSRPGQPLFIKGLGALQLTGLFLSQRCRNSRMQWPPRDAVPPAKVSPSQLELPRIYRQGGGNVPPSKSPNGRSPKWPQKRALHGRRTLLRRGRGRSVHAAKADLILQRTKRREGPKGDIALMSEIASRRNLEDSGMVSPMALADLILTTSSNCVGWALASPQSIIERTRQYQVRNKTTLGMQA